MVKKEKQFVQSLHKLKKEKQDIARRWDCRQYDECLQKFARVKSQKWTCEKCNQYERADYSEIFGYDEMTAYTSLLSAIFFTGSATVGRKMNEVSLNRPTEPDKPEKRKYQPEKNALEKFFHGFEKRFSAPAAPRRSFAMSAKQLQLNF